MIVPFVNIDYTSIQTAQLNFTPISIKIPLLPFPNKQKPKRSSLSPFHYNNNNDNKVPPVLRGHRITQQPQTATTASTSTAPKNPIKYILTTNPAELVHTKSLRNCTQNIT
jgi:hypothetical protein